MYREHQYLLPGLLLAELKGDKLAWSLHVRQASYSQPLQQASTAIVFSVYPLPDMNCVLTELSCNDIKSQPLLEIFQYTVGSYSFSPWLYHTGYSHPVCNHVKISSSYLVLNNLTLPFLCINIQDDPFFLCEL